MGTALPIMPIAQGIEASRWLLQQDEETRCFSDRPEHGWASHGSDGVRCLAMAARAAMRRMRPEPDKPKVDTKPGHYPVTLKKLFKDREGSLGKRVRIA